MVLWQCRDCGTGSVKKISFTLKTTRKISPHLKLYCCNVLDEVLCGIMQHLKKKWHYLWLGFQTMADSESVKKLLRSVLQSSKEGVSVSTLQSEYQSLCGESINLKKLGYSKLEDYLRSIPSVVRLASCMGQVRLALLKLFILQIRKHIVETNVL